MIVLSAAALAADCDAWLREHERYMPHQPCPAPPKDAQPAFSLLYEPTCSQRVPPRRCAEPVPRGAAEVTPGRAIAPPASAIDWDQFPERVETGVHSERGGSSWEAMIARRKGDCRRCFEFREDSTWWRNYIRNFLAKVLPLPGAEHILDAKQRRGRPVRFPISTFLDVGAGAGGLLVELQDMFNIQGIGISRDWQSLPFAETAAARGVLMLELDLLSRMPFPNGQFDAVHSRLSGPRFAHSNASLDSLFYEWDRVLRPGGYVVVNDWKLHGWQGGAAADGVQARFEAIVARLGWEQKMLKRTPSSLYFCYKKPLARRELGPLLPPLK